MVPLVLVVLSLVLSGQSLNLTDPVLRDEDCHTPSVVLHEGVYYSVSSSRNSTHLIPIRRSNDLIHWEKIGYVLNSTSLPEWVSDDGEAFFPELYITNSKFLVYFSVNSLQGVYAIALAYSDSVQGPFQVLEKPFLPTTGVLSPSVFQQQNQQYFLWSGAQGIYVRPLDTNVFNFTAQKPTLLLSPSFGGWEAQAVRDPAMYAHEDQLYLFYTGSFGGIGFAYCDAVDGYCYKHVNPILDITDIYLGGYPSVVKGVDNQTDFIIFSALKHNNSTNLIADLYVKKLIWVDDVPQIIDL